MTTTEIINRYNWNEAEIKTLTTMGIDKIDEIFAELDDNTIDRINYWFFAWVMGEAPKARINYWMAKTGITLEMLNIYNTL